MERKVIEQRLTELKADTKAQFGIMTAQHMIEHLTLTVKLSYGRIKLAEFEPTEKQLAQKHALLYTEIDFPKGILAPEIGQKLLDLRYPDLDTSKNELLNSIDAYNSHFAESPKDMTLHPRFGRLTHDEWERFHKKHFTHHLGQFGL
jgi:oxepin-CoA hydrolase/3-oxo-5,6-dehydrosuberyl-CoA semialdehyde dehydrogenase